MRLPLEQFLGRFWPHEGARSQSLSSICCSGPNPPSKFRSSYRSHTHVRIHVHSSRNNAGPWLPKGDPRKPQPSSSKSISSAASPLLRSHSGLLGRQIQSVLQEAVISSRHLQGLGVKSGPAAAGEKSPEGPLRQHPGKHRETTKKEQE